MKAVDIVFYINLALALLTLIHSAAICVLCKKTAFGVQTGLTGVFWAGFAILTYIIQLVLYSLRNGYAVYFVYAALGMMGSALIVQSIYCFLLGKRSDKNMCIATGVLLYVPPIGTVMLVLLSYKMRKDSRAQNLLFNGYAYTLAAIGAFTAKYPGEYIDSAAEAQFPELSKKEAFKHVKALKKKAKDPEGKYKFGVAVAHYFPMDTRIAVRAMKKASKNDYPAALFNLGYWHEIGYYFKKDLKKAREYYQRAEALGDRDATLRLGVVEIESGNEKVGVEIFDKCAKAGDECALYDYAFCLERGVGIEKDGIKAVEIYADCAKRGMYAAKRRLFWLAIKSVGEVEYDDMFRRIAQLEFEGEFSLAMEGAIAVKEKRAANAADAFLAAVKYRGKSEGVCRLFVGTLYIDCGDTEKDRQNGAAYIKTAIDMTPLAKDIYLTVPVALRGKYSERAEKKAAKQAAEKAQAVEDDKEPSLAPPAEAFKK